VSANGYVTAPETPGLGVEIHEEAFRKNGDAVIETVAEL
jgi:L-alanine-DL-glutamate epimerase-like enolase superfamily enzyme